MLLIGDGRDEYLTRTVQATMRNLHGHVTEWWMFDDSADEPYRASLRRRYPTFTVFDAGPRQGFAGAIQAAWARLRSDSAADHVLHLEQDFELTRAVNVDRMAAVLDACPYLVQMALRRQAWSATEVAAGGLVELNPDAYAEQYRLGERWLEHRLFFTTNVSLYRRSLMTMLWPQVPRSEGMFTMHLLGHGSPEAAGDDVRFGYWGARVSGVWAEHIGHQRAGKGY